LAERMVSLSIEAPLESRKHQLVSSFALRNHHTYRLPITAKCFLLNLVSELESKKMHCIVHFEVEICIPGFRVTPYHTYRLAMGCTQDFIKSSFYALIHEFYICREYLCNPYSHYF
jgi:hypothetical protein